LADFTFVLQIFLHFLTDFQHDNLLGEEELNERAGWLPLASVILAFIGESHPKIIYNTENNLKISTASLMVVQLVQHVFVLIYYLYEL
jgi:hypothetical protein